VRSRDVHHPNIVQLMGYCKHNRDIYLVSEYLQQGSLARILQKCLVFPYVASLSSLSLCCPSALVI
jgi:serine/threonine protein kinase